MADGEVTLQLVLAQEDDRLTGTFVTPHGDLAIEGSVSNGQVQLHSAVEDVNLTIVAKPAENGTLSGAITSDMGDATFTARRVKTR